MMKDKVQDDLKNAMKARDPLLLNTIRGLVAEIKKEEIDTRQPVTDERFVAVVQKEIKKRRDALEFAKTAAREDLITQNEAEIKILQGYLGEQLSEEKLKEIITGLIAGGATNIGQVMGALNKDYKGKFEGKVASEIVKEIILSG